jgi:uncharacterized protein (DUF1778 family)
MAAVTSPTDTVKSERIAVRVTPKIKERVELAAALVGRSVSDFATEALEEKAEIVIRDRRFLELSDRDMDALLAALENPPPLNDAMLRAIERHAALIAPDE